MGRRAYSGGRILGRPAGAILAVGWLIGSSVIGGCSWGPRVGERLDRRGDEIVVAGQYFHTGAPVVLWTDPGGYDAYRVERRFVPYEVSSWEDTEKAGGDKPGSPNRFNLRFWRTMDSDMRERVRGGGWTLDDCREKIDQFVFHYDVCGTSRTCFRVLHDQRGLSIHFMLDIDGTIYQTLDVKERAWHATTSNDRSVGIEIANMGAYSPEKFAEGKTPLTQWYVQDEHGRTAIAIPSRLGDGGVRTAGFVGRPSRPSPQRGTINGSELVMYDLTDQQYDSLIRLTAALHMALPKIRLEYPKDESGASIPGQLDKPSLENWTGLLGHYHVQNDKTDPGPAFDWERVVKGAKKAVR